ncbi:unnamed protein product [Rotaria sp. Silwood1]|nr:unnamed protein product [Rotaria sp. Silwood1]
MAGTYDNEEQRMVDRIKCIAFREARDEGATFINRQWIAQKIHRTTRFVTEWWEKSYDECFADYSKSDPPFIINLISAVIIITKKSRLQSNVQHNQNHKQLLQEQFQQHKHLFTTPITFVILGLPRVIIVFVSKCIKSTNDA